MKSNPTLLIIASIIVVSGMVWYFLSGNTEVGNQSSLIVGTLDNQAQARFQILVSELPTSFNTSIFSDERFNALVTLSTDTSPESMSRFDPFAPIPE